MKIKQVSVFLENKKGRLCDVTKTLFNNEINIKSLFLADTKDFGVLRMLVDDPEKAHDVLKENDFVAQTTDVIAIEVEDKPGGLYKILDIFGSSGINVEYMYAFIEKKVDNAIMIFKIDDYEKAIETLKDNNIKIYEKDIVEKL